MTEKEQRIAAAVELLGPYVIRPYRRVDPYWVKFWAETLSRQSRNSYVVGLSLYTGPSQHDIRVNASFEWSLVGLWACKLTSIENLTADRLERLIPLRKVIDDLVSVANS